MGTSSPQTLESFNFVELLPDIQSHTLLFLFDQRDLFNITSTCTSLRKIGKNAFESIWLQNGVLSVMPAVLPTVHRSTEVFLTMKWGLCTENKNYLMWGKLIKVILKDVDDWAATNPVLFKNAFEIQDPDCDKSPYEAEDGIFTEECMMYRIFGRKNLINYQEIRDYELFKAIAFQPEDETKEVCKWGIQGQYPSGEKFSLKIRNCAICSASESDSD